MEKKPFVRRSAGMRGSPMSARAEEPVISSEVPVRRPIPPAAVSPARVSRFAKPKVLMGEVTSPRGQQVSEYRDAFRGFMAAHGLRPSQWAKDADVPLGEILAYLTGRQRFFSPGVAEALARAAKVAPDAMFK